MTEGHRLRRIVVARVAAADLFREDVQVVDGIPADAEVKSTYLDPDTDAIVFIVRSDSFEPIDELATVPELKVEVEVADPDRRPNARVTDPADALEVSTDVE